LGDTTKGCLSRPQGVPGALSNQPPVPPTAPINGSAAPLNANQPGAASGSNSTRREAVTNFEVDKTVRHTRSPVGQIRRLSAAVVVNNKGSGAAATPLADKEMQSLTALAREAMGFSTTRGDTLNVLNAAFSQPEFGPVEPVPFWKNPDLVALAKEGGKALLFLLLTMIVVFGILRPALRSIAETPRPEPAAPAVPTLIVAGAPVPISQIEQVRQLAKSDPATVANVVKSWVGESKT